MEIAYPSRQLPRSTQLGLLLAVLGLFALGVALRMPTIPIVACVGVVTFCYLLKQPIFAVLFILVSNVMLVATQPSGVTDPAPSVMDWVLGAVYGIVLVYWLLRIRVIEHEPLSGTVGHQLFVAFFIWAIFISLAGLVWAHSSPWEMVREWLTWSPLLILPILFDRYVRPASASEIAVLVLLCAASVFVVVWGAIQIRSSALKAVYLYQTGRAEVDGAFSSCMVIAFTSMLMVVRKRWYVVGVSLLLIISGVGVIMCLYRTLYVATLLFVPVVLLMGTPDERRRGLRRILIVGCCVVAVATPILLHNRLTRLLIAQYTARFSSTSHYHTDISLLNRFLEWHYIWEAIKQAPIFGHGAGAKFLTYNMIDNAHHWMGFSHSSYLFMWFKTGIIGFVLFFGSYLWYVFAGWKLVRHASLRPYQRAVLRASFVALLVQLFNCFTYPTLDTKIDIGWIAISIGLLVMYRAHVRRVAASEASIGTA